MKNIKPNIKEKIVLQLFYNRFYVLYDELIDKDFFKLDPLLRFYKIREIFSVYKELLSYEPIRHYLKYSKYGGRPPMEGVVIDDLFSFVRNLLLHFPIYEKWDDVYINMELATWIKPGRIHTFLQKCTMIKIDGKGEVKYRIWEKSKNLMTYVSINFPQHYQPNSTIFLKDIITEKDGVKLCISFMLQVLNTQIEIEKNDDIVIMSQVLLPKELCPTPTKHNQQQLALKST